MCYILGLFWGGIGFLADLRGKGRSRPAQRRTRAAAVPVHRIAA